MTSVRPYPHPPPPPPNSVYHPRRLSALVQSVYIFLVLEERPDVQRVRRFLFSSLGESLLKPPSLQALTRLTPREAYDRAYRFKRASQASVLHNDLPKSEWTNPEHVSPREHPRYKY